MKMFKDFNYDIQGDYSYDAENKIVREYAVIFEYMGEDTKVVVPSEIDGFPVVTLSETFFNKDEIEEIVLPDTLEKISNFCFCGCLQLKKINFPESLISIGCSAFENCFSLEDVTCSNNVEWAHNLKIGHRDLGHNVFRNCSKLFDTNGFFIINSVLVAFDGKSDVITIPFGVTKIGDCTFHSCENLTSVTMTDSIIDLGSYAFYKCSALSYIAFSNNIKLIMPETFLNCKSLNNIVLPQNLEAIYYAGFSKCTALEQIRFLDEVMYIGDLAFNGCASLRDVTIPKSVNTICDRAFSRCENLVNVEFLPRPDGLDGKITTQVGCFYYTAKMRENMLVNGVELHHSVVDGFKKADEETYRLDQILMWESLSQTSKEFFIGEWNKKISYKSKKMKNKLRNLVFLKSSVKEMSYYFDAGCKLELVELDEYIEFSIKSKNTLETERLLEYKSVAFDNEYVEQQKTQKEKIEICLTSPALQELRENWKVLLRKEHLIVTGYKGKNKTETLTPTIDNGRHILYIGSGTYGCLEELIIPEGVIGILENAFFLNTNIKKIVIPNSVTEIGDFAFFKTSIEEIVIPSGVTKIENRTFGKCKNLKKVILGNIDTVCENIAFTDCENLEFVGVDGGENIIKKFKIER